MAYSSPSDIQSEFKSVTFSVSSTPTLAAVQEFIVQADQQINSRVGTRFQVPVTGTLSLVILKAVSIGLVVGRVKAILRVATGDPKTSQEARGGNPAKDADAMLNAICGGTLLLPDAIALSTGQGVQSGVVQAGYCPVFRRDTEQW